MKKYLPAIALLALTACGVPITVTPQDPAPVVTVTAPAPEPAVPAPAPTLEPPAPSIEELYITQLHKRADFRVVPDKTLIKAGKAACDALDAGNTMDAVLLLAGQSLGAKNGAWLVGTAVAAYCPEYGSELS